MADPLMRPALVEVELVLPKQRLEMPGLALVRAGQVAQGIVDRDEIGGAVAREQRLVEGQRRLAVRALEPPPRARVVDEDVPHAARRDGDEVAAAVPVTDVILDEANEGLADER